MEILKVDTQYRTNPLSFIDGGSTVIVEFINGTKREYDNVKNTDAYIKQALARPKVKNAYIK